MGTVICIRRRKRQQHGTCEKPGDAETGDPVLSENGMPAVPSAVSRKNEYLPLFGISCSTSMPARSQA